MPSPIVGRRVGRTVVEGVVDRITTDAGYIMYRLQFRCDCGNKFVTDTNAVYTKNKNYACAPCRKEHRVATRVYTTNEYKIWCGMLARCYDPNSEAYRYYGAKGIEVCDRWREPTGRAKRASRKGYDNFYADMGPRPSVEHSVDRIDNNGPYSPENCRWATAKEQMNNTSQNVWVEYRGRRKTVAQWADVLRIDQARLRSSLNSVRYSAQDVIELYLRAIKAGAQTKGRQILEREPAESRFVGPRLDYRLREVTDEEIFGAELYQM